MASRTYRFALLLVAVAAPILAVAQRECKVRGEYLYQYPTNVSYDEACQLALLKAQNEALADEFGTYVVQDGVMITENRNGTSDQQLYSVSQSQVKGEWLGDTEPPRFERLTQDGRDYVKVSVRGRAREITGAGVDFIAKPLRSSLDLRHASTEFREGDDLYVFFRTPQDGYLCIYLFDKAQDEVYCLLPYQESNGAAYHVSHDTDYYLFSKSKARTGEPVTELEMTIAEGRREEFNDLYVVFSPNSFSKANTSAAERQLSEDLVVPRSMRYKEFNKWLVKYRTKDKDMRSQRISLKILPKD